MPGAAVSVLPTCGVPAMLGGARFLSGSGCTVPVGGLAAEAEPPALAAVTRTATVLPTSAAASV